jgi:glycosyltransferase involved in cell wall biosynthesis
MISDRACLANSAADLPLFGKVVVLVHPAWHSCGSYQVFLSQARAYRALGAHVLDLAIADMPGSVEGSRHERAYLAATANLEASRRFYAGMPLHSVFDTGYFRALNQWLHGNTARSRIETTIRARLPAALTDLPSIDLIHCNHYFCMPAALRLRGNSNCPILLDTHDIQALQYELSNKTAWLLPPVTSFEEMLDLELAAMRPATVLIHLNDEEAGTFQKLLPQMRHQLLYPTVEPLPSAPGRSDLIIVASANYPNFLGVEWFLTEILPKAPGIPVRIIGNIDEEFSRKAPRLRKAHASLFRGQVRDLGETYRNAGTILLPTKMGHGISIKTVEAMSSGAPLIATSHAFRGMGLDPAGLANVTLADDSTSFAAAMRRAAANSCTHSDEARSDMRQVYERKFGFEAYCQALRQIAVPLVNK